MIMNQKNILQKSIAAQDFDAIRLTIASPAHILAWSYGEVAKPETINYRTQKPERDGLFDERIFGPTKDFECYCGKYKKIRFKGVICDKCGVEVTRSSVRRERMGHINLAVPIAHIWYIRGVPSILGTILDLAVSDLEKVIYFAAFIILEVDEAVRKTALESLEREYSETVNNQPLAAKAELDLKYRELKRELNELKPHQVISELKYHDLSLKYGNIVRVSIGAESIYEVLTKINLDQLMQQLVEQGKTASPTLKRKILKRLKTVQDFKQAESHPSWLILSRLPVLPPDLRPMVQLDGGRFAASDLNDLYRRVINRNNRLKRLLSQGAPEVITRNEKRMLQEAVDALIDNSARKGRATQTTAGTRRLRSLSDMLRGKQGRFRQNLLGKRVDYSGRSVIVVGPELKLQQCGLPKIMALELFKPFVISRLIKDNLVHNVKNASRMIERGDPVVWDILEQITDQSYVLLNRAPTLHRLGIQAFQPILIEGKAIQIHPLVCYAYNADFDGDQMAVHIPLSKPAIDEAKNLMLSMHNLLKPASGEPVVHPRYDIVFGCYYLTAFNQSQVENSTLKCFSSPNEAFFAHHERVIGLRDKIKVKINDQLVETSVGRIIFNEALPEELRFINEAMNSKSLKKLIAESYGRFGREKTAQLADNIKEVGFHYATISGLTIAMSDLDIPENKHQLVEKGEKEVAEVEKQYRRGLITEEEKRFKEIEIWTLIRSEIEKSMVDSFNKESPVYKVVQSGARGSFAQIIQMSGMKGLVVSPTGTIIPLPIKANFKEGLDVYEYFISTHGARKGKSDTSLRTSDAGYLTRRLVDVAQDMVISAVDCGSQQGLNTSRKKDNLSLNDFIEKIRSRVILRPLYGLKNQEIVPAGMVITDEIIDKVNWDEIDEAVVRSPLTCALSRGICQLCYGEDLGLGGLVKKGEAVGIIAAQAIGEPGTQLTMKTFHLGGVFGEDITTGLPRVEELFEARPPKRVALLAELDGQLTINEVKENYQILLTTNEPKVIDVDIYPGFNLLVSDGQLVRAREVLAESESKKAIRSSHAGRVSIIDNGQKIKIISREKVVLEYIMPISVNLTVTNGQSVEKGQPLTEDHFDLALALKLQGRERVQKYIINQIQEIYQTQGQAIHDKHLEIIIRQMFSKVRTIDAGGSDLFPGQVEDLIGIKLLNERLLKDKQNPVVFEELVLGITRVALKTASFLSAASFQDTTSTLIDAATRGAMDYLRGLKENVIIGRPIPAGTGYRKG